jgi:hypothetical protein
VRRLAWLICVAACGSDDAMTRIDAAPCVDTGHDEDGDGVGDNCDVCPTAPDPAQRDTTEAATMLAFPDGVGDACDPRTNVSGDTLAAFHPFADAAEAGRWNGSGWTIENDQARATDAARWIAKMHAPGDGIYVQARIARLAWQPTGTFEVIVDGDDVGIGYGCAIAKDRDGDGNDEIDVREIGVVTMTKSVGKEITGAITLSTWRIFDAMRRGTIRCRLTFEGGDATFELPTTDDIAVGTYGFASQTAMTDVTSIIVYTSPTLPPGK